MGSSLFVSASPVLNTPEIEQISKQGNDQDQDQGQVQGKYQDQGQVQGKDQDHNKEQKQTHPKEKEATYDESPDLYDKLEDPHKLGRIRMREHETDPVKNDLYQKRKRNSRRKQKEINQSRFTKYGV
jgi:hypothetical protein